MFRHAFPALSRALTLAGKLCPPKAALGWRPRSCGLREMTRAGYFPSSSPEPLDPALSSVRRGRSPGTAATGSRPRGLLGFGQWGSPTGDQKVGELGPVVGSPSTFVPGCWEFTAFSFHLPAVSPDPLGQNQGLLPWGTVSSFVGFSKLSVHLEIASLLNFQPPHLRAPSVSSWNPK